MRLSARALAFGAIVGLGAVPLEATWSIVAVDRRTREVGSAGASCTGFVAGIVGIAPGHGVIVAQARSNSRARERGVDLLAAGASPSEVLQVVTDEGFDRRAQEQQYGIAALGFESAVAAFTGNATMTWSGDRQGRDVSVQGNILVGPEVLGDVLAAFEALPDSASLAERLLVALEAGAAAGGDRRCGAQTALSAYLVVARPSDTARNPTVRIVVPGQRRGGANPIAIVRAEFDALGRR